MAKKKKKNFVPQEKVVLSEEWRKDADFERITSSLPSVENTCQKKEASQWKECDSYSWFKVLERDLPASTSLNSNELNDFMMHLKLLASDDSINRINDKAEKLAIQRESKKNKKAKDLITYKVRLYLTMEQRKAFCQAEAAFRWTYNQCIIALTEVQGEDLRSLSKLKKKQELRKRFINSKTSISMQNNDRWVFEVPYSIRDYAMQQAVDAFEVNKSKQKENPNFKFELDYKKKKAGKGFFMVGSHDWSEKGYTKFCPGPFVIGDSRLKCEWNTLASDTNVFCKNYKWYLSMTIDRSLEMSPQQDQPSSDGHLHHPLHSIFFMAPPGQMNNSIASGWNQNATNGLPVGMHPGNAAAASSAQPQGMSLLSQALQQKIALQQRNQTQPSQSRSCSPTNLFPPSSNSMSSIFGMGHPGAAQPVGPSLSNAHGLLSNAHSRQHSEGGPLSEATIVTGSRSHLPRPLQNHVQDVGPSSLMSNGIAGINGGAQLGNSFMPQYDNGGNLLAPAHGGLPSQNHAFDNQMYNDMLAHAVQPSSSMSSFDFGQMCSFSAGVTTSVSQSSPAAKSISTSPNVSLANKAIANGNASKENSVGTNTMINNHYPSNASEQQANPIDHGRIESANLDAFEVDEPGDVDPDEMAKKDPLATQVRRMHAKQNATPANAAATENLTWRMMAMTPSKKKEQERLEAAAGLNGVTDLQTPSSERGRTSSLTDDSVGLSLPTSPNTAVSQVAFRREDAKFGQDAADTSRAALEGHLQSPSSISGKAPESANIPFVPMINRGKSRFAEVVQQEEERGRSGRSSRTPDSSGTGTGTNLDVDALMEWRAKCESRSRSRSVSAMDWRGASRSPSRARAPASGLSVIEDETLNEFNQSLPSTAGFNSRDLVALGGQFPGFSSTGPLSLDAGSNPQARGVENVSDHQQSNVQPKQLSRLACTAYVQQASKSTAHSDLLDSHTARPSPRLTAGLEDRNVPFFYRSRKKSKMDISSIRASPLSTFGRIPGIDDHIEHSANQHPQDDSSPCLMRKTSFDRKGKGRSVSRPPRGHDNHKASSSSNNRKRPYEPSPARPPISVEERIAAGLSSTLPSFASQSGGFLSAIPSTSFDSSEPPFKVARIDDPINLLSGAASVVGSSDASPTTLFQQSAASTGDALSEAGDVGSQMNQQADMNQMMQTSYGSDVAPVQEVQKPLFICSIDPGVRTFATIYDPIRGKVYQWGDGCEKVMNENSVRLHRLIMKQKRVKSRKRCRIQKAVDRLRIRIENLITDLHKKLCHWLAERYDFIILPRFGTHGMVKKGGRKIGKRTVRSIFSLGHCRFLNRLNAKVFIPKYTEEFTSQTCSACGHKYKVGSSHKYDCKQCKMQACRDCNGAKNILLKALIEFLRSEELSGIRARPANSSQGYSLAT